MRLCRVWGETDEADVVMDEKLRDSLGDKLQQLLGRAGLFDVNVGQDRILASEKVWAACGVLR